VNAKGGRVAQLAEQCPFKAWVDGSSPSALTSNPLGLLDLHSQGFFSQKILTHTQPTACEPTHLNVVHFLGDRLSVLAQHDLRVRVPHVALGGVVYGGGILAAIAAYAYSNRIAPAAGSVSILILALALAAFACLAGTSGQTWTDPSNALAALLIACAFLLDGFFIAGARTFGPKEVLDVGLG
jgi:hypothetical protein